MIRNGYPVLLEQVPLHPDGPRGGLFTGEVRVPLEGEITALIECDARSFPLEPFCRFVRHGPKSPYTFPNMEFARHPPGLRIGPWPGWREIPEFPELTLTIGTGTGSLKAVFWGDEFATGVVRFVGTTTCGSEATIVVHSPDPRLEPRSAFLYRTSSVHATSHPLSPSPAAAENRRLLLVHPGTVGQLRAAAGTSHRFIWRKIVGLLNNWNLPFEKTPESKAVPGPERLSHEDRVLLSAFVALLEPTPENARRALRAFREYRSETQQPEYEPLRIDTQAGETLFILSLAYDWLRDIMPDDEKQEADRRLREVADICWGHLGYERKDYAQAHYLGCGLGLLAFSLLFWNDHPHAREWAEHLRGALDCILDLLPADGSYPHGMNLWIYETGFLLRWIELIRGSTGEDIWHSRRLDHFSDFRAATLSPDGLYGITLGDPQYRVGGDSWCHFLIATRTRSALAQRLGMTLQDLPHEGVDYRHVPPRRRVYEFIFFDPSVPTAENLPPMSWFEDTGQLCRRSASSLFTFRSGSPLGRRRYAQGEYGAYGHSDPAQGSFLLHRNGAFAVSGPGPVYRRDTALHNVITIDGKGQIGDSTVWLPDFIPPERLVPPPEIRSDGRRVLLTAGLLQSYLPHLDVEFLSRSMAVDIDRYILGVDQVRCRATHNIEWNAHAWGPILRSEADDTFLFPGETRLVFLAPAKANVFTGLSEFVPAYPHDGTRDVHLVIAVRAQDIRFIWCFLMTGEPAPYIATDGPLRFTVHFNNRHTVAFDGHWLMPDDFNAAQT